MDAANQSAVAMARTGPTHILRQKLAKSLRSPSSSLDAVHSRSRLRVMSTRPVVRTIASRLKYAS